MDASIMKLLEEDEDESMHSGADVDAFQAALNRDIGGGGEEPVPAPAATGGESAPVSQNQSPDSTAAVFPQDGSNYSRQSTLQWSAPSQDGKSVSQTQEDMKSRQQTEQHSSQMELTRQVLDDMNQQQQTDIPNPLQQHQSQEDHQQKQAEQIPHQIARTTAMQTPQQNPFSVREPERAQFPDSESQYIKLQRMSNQQATINEQANNQMNRSKQVPFGALLPVIMPQLDKDRAMQLSTLYTKLKKNEIPKEGFVRHMKSIVGDQMLKMAVMKIQQPHSGPSQIQLQSQASAQQQHLRMPPVGASNTQLHNSPVGPSYVAAPAVKMQNSSSYTSMENNPERTRDVERQSDSPGVQLSQLSSEKEQSAIPLQAHNKQQQQQHFQYPQASLSVTGGSSGGNYYPYPGANVSSSSSTLKPQSHDSQMRQIPLHHSMGSTQLGGATQAMHMMNVSKFDKQNSINDPKRMQGGSQTHFSNNSALQQNPVPWQATGKEQNSGHLSSVNTVKQEPIDQSNEQQNKPQLSSPQGLPSFSAAHFDRGSANSGTLRDEPSDKQPSKLGFPASSSMMPPTSVSPSMTTQLDPNDQLGSRMPSLPASAGVNARTSPKKPLVGQKKPLEAPGSSPPASKKQKASGAFLDQSIEQLNDVTAVSGVNLREEEEQLFSGPKEDSRVSEASRRVVQEEEERLILQKNPLQKKLAEIMAKFGLKNLSNDVERCLSLCVEERLRGLVCNLIRFSKHRADMEKLRHRTIITSDVRQQILTMNRKAREEWERKQAEAEKLKKLNEPDSNNGVTGEKEKDEVRAKSQKVNKEEDEKMRTTAANVAARAAVGGDDMLSKWQLMAEQNRQKREGGVEGASGSHTGKDVSRKSSLNSGKTARELQEGEKKGLSAPHSVSRGVNRKFGRNQVGAPQNRVSRTISVRDVIAVLEREPQMSKSALLYRLYDKVHSEAAAE